MPEPFKPTWDERQRMKRNAGKLRHSVQQCQPEADGLRQAQPVCCYCDNDLSCAQCGREQPHDDVSALKAEIATLQARVEELKEALEQIRTAHAGYCITDENQYPGVVESFWKEIQRMERIARTALSLEDRK